MHTEFSNDITPFIIRLFLLPFVLWNFFSILIEIGCVTYSNLSSTTTTRFAFLLLNRYILVIVNRDVITYFCRCGNESLILNWNGETMLNCILILRLNSWSDNLLILRKFRFWFFEFYLQVFSCNHWSYDILFVVNISWSLNGFSSEFFLNNWLSFNWFVFNHSISSIYKSNLHTFLFNDWLNNGLIYVFVRR